MGALASSPSVPIATTCPNCTTELPADDRFPVWCHACEWNLVPPRPKPDGSAKERRKAARNRAREERREQVARRRAERLYHALERGDGPGADRNWLIAAALAGVVHLVTVAVVLGSLWLVVTGTLPMRLVGCLGLLIGFLLRPRFGRIRTDDSFLTRAQAPQLYALADRVATAVGGRPVDRIRVTGSFNASFGRFGLRRRGVLEIGLPLWAVLSAPERVALLGHELGHDVNGDHRRGLWLHSAVAAVREWHLLTLDDETPSEDGLVNLVQALLLVPRLLLQVLTERLLFLLDRLTSRSGQGAEYRADLLAATVASPAAARGMLAALLLEPTAEAAVVRIRSRSRLRTSRPGRDGGEAVAELWTELAGLAGGLTPRERERRLRLGAHEFAAVDSTHPPTHLRIALLDRPVEPRPVAFGRIEQEKVEAELAPARGRVGERLLDG